MPAILEEGPSAATEGMLQEYTELPFPPVTKQQILNCSYHSWHPKYRAVTPKARLIPLSPPFLQYLRSDGIILPDEDNERPYRSQDDDSGIFSASDNNNDDDEEEDEDISAPWSDVHETIRNTIAELGGKVVPKLNWSAPKDATWMNATNNMECRTPNDIYLLLKSSDFVTHDLEHAFDDTVGAPGEPSEIPYHLVLRKAVQMNPSVEFRCFVRNRKLIGICQRDMNHFDFLFPMENRLRSQIQQFFDLRLRDTFADENFVFDVYVPAPHDRVWLIDINPWAPRTDPLLFSWLEMLTMDEPPEQKEHESKEEEVVSIPIRPAGQNESLSQDMDAATRAIQTLLTSTSSPSDSEDEEEADEELWQPEFRLIGKNDPEAYSFATPQYSAHKLPKDVVDASQSGEGLREFARDWKNVLEKRRREDEVAQSSGDDD